MWVDCRVRKLVICFGLVWIDNIVGISISWIVQCDDCDDFIVMNWGCVIDHIVWQAQLKPCLLFVHPHWWLSIWGCNAMKMFEHLLMIFYASHGCSHLPAIPGYPVVRISGAEPLGFRIFRWYFPLNIMKQGVLRSYFDCPKHVIQCSAFRRLWLSHGTVKKQVKIQGYLMVAGEMRWELLYHDHPR